jgi:hypothetical protein
MKGIVISICFASLVLVSYSMNDVSADSDVAMPSVLFDKSVYPVPFGGIDDFEKSEEPHPDGRSIFPVHHSAIVTGKIQSDETLGTGDLTVHIRVYDATFDVSSYIDKISQDIDGKTVGPLKISIVRDSQTLVLAYAGGNTPQKNGLVDVDNDNPDTSRQLGPIFEVAPDSGTFELDFVIRYTDGPSSPNCPATSVFTSLNVNAASGSEESRFDKPSPDNESYCILKGDVLTVEYTSVDTSRETIVQTYSATFDLRNGELVSDKPVYNLGDIVILTLIDQDFDLDSFVAETYDLDLIEWDSFTATLTMGDLGGEAAAFDPEPTDFRETGSNTGIFQLVFEIPKILEGNQLERGEEIVLEYTDWGSSEAEYVGQEDEDIGLTIHTSNFGANIQPEQKIPPPKQQIKNNIEPTDISCKTDLVLIFKASDNSPACVKPSTVQKLLERGWANK